MSFYEKRQEKKVLTDLRSELRGIRVGLWVVTGCFIFTNVMLVLDRLGV